MKDAVRKSFEESEKGDAVLLAPACASFDMFKSFEERGKVFKQEVVEISSRFKVQSSKL
jgi:UDP-N-acetylmuramoylalanine--D-glutamate ligase